MCEKIQGKVHRTRPDLVHEAEPLSLKKTHGKKLKVAEMRMLCTMDVRVTKLDRIRKERIRQTMKVGEISKKVQERRVWMGM